MFFNPQKYLTSPSEKIIYRFGISLRYVIVSISLWTIFLGGLAYGLKHLGVGNVLEKTPLVILILIALYYTLQFCTTSYFVSQQRIYKRTGFGFTSILSAKHDQIEDMQVIQGLLQKLLFNTGTLNFNTSGSLEPEISLLHVASPFNVKQELYDAWE